MISVIIFKMSKHSDFHLSFFQIVGGWQDFTVVTKLIKSFKSLDGFFFGGHCLKIRRGNFCKDHRDKIEAPDPLVLEDLISYKLNNGRKLARLNTE